MKIGISEKQLYKVLLSLIAEADLEPAFDPIIAVDSNSALPHYSTKNGNNQIIKDNSVILIDFGIKKNFYLSDMTRMIFMPKTPQSIINQYQQLVKIQQQAINRLSLGSRNKFGMTNMALKDILHSFVYLFLGCATLFCVQVLRFETY